MKVENMKALLDACYEGKRIREFLPQLPKGVTSSYIHYLDVIETLEKQNIQVKVSDISDSLNIPRPGATRTVKEMTKSGYLKKLSSVTDGRITYVTITEKGKKLHNTYTDNFFSKLEPLLINISDDEAIITIQTIHKLYQIMQEERIHLKHE